MSRKNLIPVLTILVIGAATTAFADDILWNYDDTFVEGDYESTLSTWVLPIEAEEVSWFFFEVNEETSYLDHPGSRVIVEMDPRDTDDVTVAHFEFLE